MICCPHNLLCLTANLGVLKTGGVFGTTRFLKNVMGLWFLQECQRSWAYSGHVTDYDTLLADVVAVPAFAALIDPDDARFLAPEDMPAAITTR